MEKEISQAVIRRMPRYHRYLGELLDAGIERISSRELSAMMKVTASQIRQDLNNFGGFGQTGYGYNVGYLYDEIGKILGLTSVHSVIVVGVGNLGRAIARYIAAGDGSFKLTALFDSDPGKAGQWLGDVMISDIREMEDFCRENQVDIAVLTLPKEYATDVAGKLISYGVKAFWNFANIDLDVPEDVALENVNLSESLMHLSYSMIKNT